MDALEFYKSHESAPLPDIGDLLSLTVEEICELMEQYHQSKVNNSVLGDVMALFKPNELWRMAQKYNCDDFIQMIEQSKSLNKL